MKCFFIVNDIWNQRPSLKNPYKVIRRVHMQVFMMILNILVSLDIS